jgi:hypothetical protein
MATPAIYSWTRMAIQPSTFRSVRTVEWLRMHHLNWLVDEVEHALHLANAARVARS